MKSIRLLAPTFFTFTFVSCSVDKPNQYDTASPYGTADTGAINPPENPVYDTPAAYEESSTTASGTPGPISPIAPYDPTPSIATPTPRPAAIPSARPNGAANIHTVVAGDTLSGLSAKYKVPSAAIKQANQMTTDTVVLGRKMVIPPVQ